MIGGRLSISCGANSRAVAAQGRGAPQVVASQSIAHSDYLLPWDVLVLLAESGRHIPCGFTDDVKGVTHRKSRTRVLNELLCCHSFDESMRLTRIGQHILKIEDRVARHSITASARMRSRSAASARPSSPDRP